MQFVITHANNVTQLASRCLQLCDDGKWSQYMRRPEHNFLSNDNTMTLEMIMAKVATVYADDSDASHCLIYLPIIDIIGDAENDDYVTFLDDVGLTVLAYGEPRTDTCPYDQIENGNADILAMYESVAPRIFELDEDGNQTGITRFNKGAEFDRTHK